MFNLYKKAQRNSLYLEVGNHVKYYNNVYEISKVEIDVELFGNRIVANRIYTVNDIISSEHYGNEFVRLILTDSMGNNVEISTIARSINEDVFDKFKNLTSPSPEEIKDFEQQKEF
jgi:hypothetical protein